MKIDKQSWTWLTSLCFMATFFSSFSIEPQPHSDDFVSVAINLDRERATIEISNPLKHELELLSVGLDFCKSHWHASPRQASLTVPVDKYVLWDKTSRRYYSAALLGNQSDRESLNIEVSQWISNTDGWAYIPAGAAMIGDELGIGSPDEGRARRITTDAFWLKQHETTNAEYCKFLNEQDEVDNRWIDLKSRKCLIKTTADNGHSPKKFVPDTALDPTAAAMPVVMVSYFGAVAYCDWLTETTGQQHRLLTESEWEKAARGPFSYVYSYGNRYQPEQANQESGQLRAIKKYQPNAYGLYDMTGNAFEWMNSRFDESDTAKVMNQALRGGSFVLDGMYQRCSFRMRQSPTVMTDDFSFRVLRETDSKERQ